MQPRITLFHRQRIHDMDSDNIPEFLKPKSEETKINLTNILRWEDDGGKIIEIHRSTLVQKRRTPNA
jgi:hypothetical protein